MGILQIDLNRCISLINLFFLRKTYIKKGTLVLGQRGLSTSIVFILEIMYSQLTNGKFKIEKQVRTRNWCE